jgi:uracil-DNA glycosylase
MSSRNSAGDKGAAPLARLLAEARACQHCAAVLPDRPRPVLRAHVDARILVVGQAPGTRVHESGVPFDDRSGDRLRAWLGVDRPTFYDEHRIAIVPMGLCFPGLDAKGSDLPPRKECGPIWQPRLKAALPAIGLTLLIGGYAQRYHLGARIQPTLTATVAAFRDYLPAHFVLPHPSWRNTGWLKRNPWFEASLLPELRRRVAELIG